MVKVKIVPRNVFCDALDWRAAYHLSPAADFPKLAKKQNFRLLSARENVSFIDGWRFSDNPKSDWYLTNIEFLDLTRRDRITRDYLSLEVDEASHAQAKNLKQVISEERYYRMRHVSDMRLVSEKSQYQRPLIDEEYCVKPGDVVIRRVGSAGAAFVSEFDRQHPIDANMAIIRGLPTDEAIWLAFCLQQPLYIDYLEQKIAVTDMVRVGLSQLKKLPFADKPKLFDEAALNYQEHLASLNTSQIKLHELREQVASWVTTYLQENDIFWTKNQRKVARFITKDIGDKLNFGYTEQNKVSRKILNLGGKYLKELLSVESDEKPSAPRICSLIRIKDLQQDLTISNHLTQIDSESDESKFLIKVKKRVLKQNDVLVSTFAKESKLAWINQVPEEPMLANEHLTTLLFEQYAGAYTLLMETELVQWQMNQLVAGTMQAFINNSDLQKVVLPPLPDELANDWHEKLDNALTAQRKALLDLGVVKQQMKLIFDAVHPDVAGETHD